MMNDKNKINDKNYDTQNNYKHINLFYLLSNASEF